MALSRGLFPFETLGIPLQRICIVLHFGLPSWFYVSYARHPEYSLSHCFTIVYMIE